MRHGCSLILPYVNIVLVEPELCVNQDTLVENLHTFLLGAGDKYTWHATHTQWDATQCQTFVTRLKATSVDALSMPPIPAKYVVQYRNNLIGCHFKTLQQTAVFSMRDDLCSPLLLDLWKATGELGALLWYHEIQDMDGYLVSCAAPVYPHSLTLTHPLGRCDCSHCQCPRHMGSH